MEHRFNFYQMKSLRGLFIIVIVIIIILFLVFFIIYMFLIKIFCSKISINEGLEELGCGSHGKNLLKLALLGGLIMLIKSKPPISKM